MIGFATRPIGNVLRRIRGEWRYYNQKHAMKGLVHSKFKKIVLGASGTKYEGFVSTDQDTLDLLRPDTWTAFLKPNSLDVILAEHVWEHLRPQEAIIAAETCFTFLQPGGHLRVAVPDGFHPDQAYIEAVRPGGSGKGSDDHKVLYTYLTFRDLFNKIGFEVVLQEYFDEHGNFHSRDWDMRGGMIQRSRRYDSRNTADRLAYSSIILDAIKPQVSVPGQ